MTAADAATYRENALRVIAQRAAEAAARRVARVTPTADATDDHDREEGQ